MSRVVLAGFTFTYTHTLLYSISPSLLLFVFQCLFLIHQESHWVFILVYTDHSLADFQRSGVWCPSTTPGFTKADARIAFGQSAPDPRPSHGHQYVQHTHTHLDAQLCGLVVETTSIHRCERVNGMISSIHPYNFVHLLKLNITIEFDPQGSVCRWTRRKGIVRVEQTNDWEARRKEEEKRERENALTHACPLSGWHHDERRGHHRGAGPSKRSQRCDPVQKKKWVPRRSHRSKKKKAWDDNSAQQ